MMIAGLEVPHVHVHLVPIDTLEDINFAHQDANARTEDLDAAAEKVRTALRKLGCKAVADG